MRSFAVALALVPIGTFSSPVYVTAPPGDTSRVFVVEQGGTIRVVRDGVVEPTPFLTVPSGQLIAGGESAHRAGDGAADPQPQPSVVVPVLLT